MTYNNRACGAEAWVRQNYDAEQLRDIAEHGCAACAPSGLTYYGETEAFYDEHELELLDELESFVQDCYGQTATVWQVFGSDAGTAQQLKNALVWAFVELLAQRWTGG